jgi:hypothetical protein
LSEAVSKHAREWNFPKGYRIVQEHLFLLAASEGCLSAHSDDHNKKNSKSHFYKNSGQGGTNLTQTAEGQTRTNRIHKDHDEIELL